MRGDGGAVMRSMVRMFATGDLDEVEAVISPDYLDHQGLDGVSLRGPEGFRRVVAAARGGCESLGVEIEDLIVEGDRVAARIRWHAVSRAGATSERETIDIIRAEHGRAVEHSGTRL